MTVGRPARLGAALAGLIVLGALALSNPLNAADSIPSPEQFIGFQVGADSRLARWDRIVAYMQRVASASDRVRVRELGKTNGGNPFVVVEIAAPDTLKNADRYKQLERKLYFQDGPPSARERDEIFRRGKVVVAVTSSVHATEVGATQMSLELVHRLATDDSPAVRKILDNVIFLLVPSANPDGQILVTDWFNSNVGTPYEASAPPILYHPYAGHDLNRDMYMLTQKESQYIAELMWHDWLPAVWLDQHQMGSSGPRIFVMPAGDPINPNVHPLIYRWNGILGQSQAAALEAAGKDGIIYNATYTNFWQGALAWSGWWHNQIGLLTEVAGVQIAAPIDQERATRSPAAPASQPRRSDPDIRFDGRALAPPTDITPRTEYPRPWMGGRWTLRDIVDYELITTMALLETAADRRETILRQIYEVNRQTVESAGQGEVGAILVPLENQHDPREAVHLAGRLIMAGVAVYRADAAFDADSRRYPSGTFVIPMTQVFARYARDLLEKQTYPEVQRGPETMPAAPYDVTAWSLGMLLGVEVDFVRTAMDPSVKMTRVGSTLKMPGAVSGSGTTFGFAYAGPDTAIAINRLLGDGADVRFDRPSHVTVAGVGRGRMEAIARDLGLTVTATATPAVAGELPGMALGAPRIALYSPWMGGNIDEGWTRWVLEQFEFNIATVRNHDLREGALRQRFDAIILPDQSPREIMEGHDFPSIRPEYRGGIGATGAANLRAFVAEGGTLVALGAATELAIDQLRAPVRNLKRGLRRDQHYAPGTIVRIDVDTSHPVGYGMAANTYGFYADSPFFTLIDGFSDSAAAVVARYPSQNITASGWSKGEELMAGRAAVVSIEMNPGRIVLFGLRPQHRAQTHATFPMLFNALYLSAAGNQDSGAGSTSPEF